MNLPPQPPAIYAPAHINEKILLEAIADVETGNDWHKEGKHGETGAYQIKQSVWEQHMRGTGYSWALFRHNRIVNRAVAKRHLEFIMLHLPHNGIRVTPINIAACWNLGLEGGVAAIRIKRIPDSADRVQNIYEDLTP